MPKTLEELKREIKVQSNGVGLYFFQWKKPLWKGLDEITYGLHSKPDTPETPKDCDIFWVMFRGLESKYTKTNAGLALKKLALKIKTLKKADAQQ